MISLASELTLRNLNARYGTVGIFIDEGLRRATCLYWHAGPYELKKMDAQIWIPRDDAVRDTVATVLP